MSAKWPVVPRMRKTVPFADYAGSLTPGASQANAPVRKAWLPQMQAREHAPAASAPLSEESQ